MSGSPILVGYDGSQWADAALRWALDEAARHAAPVRLLYVYEWATSTVPVPVSAGWPALAARQQTVDALDEALARARAARPELTIDNWVLDGTVVPTLCSLSERGRLLVLGNRGLGGFDGLQTGSVALTLATCARCPVVVHRGSARPIDPVVVGVDDYPDMTNTFNFAADQAASRGVDLVAVRGWGPPPLPSRSDTAAPDHDLAALEQAEREMVAEALREGQGRRPPQVHVVTRLAPSSAAQALVDASVRAQLVVVGASGRAGSPGLPLGSVTRALIHHSHCPVAVVRADVGSRPPYGAAR